MSVEELKAALESGKPTRSTVTLLGSLLGVGLSNGSDGSRNPAKSKPNGSASKTAATAITTAAPRKPKKPVSVAFHEDDSTELPGREKYVLATHAINHGLKVLSSSLKSNAKSQNVESSPDSANVPSTPNAALHGPLQPRSANISPMRPSPTKTTAGIKGELSSPQKSLKDAPSSILAMAQCAQKGFLYLIDADFQALGVREMPPWQLETGLLALTGSMISHGLNELAASNLRIVKQRLETTRADKAVVKGSKPSRSQPTTAEKESLISLLRLSGSLAKDSAALSIAITYQQHVIKLISKSPTPSVLEHLPDYVAIDQPNGPVDLVIQHVKATKDSAKAAKQLETLSRTLIGLGPGVAHSCDAVAMDVKLSPSPEATMRLQTIALQIRKLWWKLAKHQPDVAREFIEPFTKCASAFVRRQNRRQEEGDTLQRITACLDAVGPFDQNFFGDASFAIHNLLCSQAESQGETQHAQKWAKLMTQDCIILEQSHARVIVAHLWTAALAEGALLTERETSVAIASAGLQSKITGSGADYDMLIEAADCLSRTMYSRRNHGLEAPALVKLLMLSATFCQRYARSYPGRKSPRIASILSVAVRFSQTTDDLVSWITQDAAAVFVQTGAWKAVAGLAATRPLLEVWSASQDSLSLSRIVNTLLLKAIRSNSTSTAALHFDDEKLDSAERGILLEWQLQCGADLASQDKYHEALKKLLPELLRRLAKLYDGCSFPIRRSRAASLALGIREAHPNLIPPHVLKIWQDIPSMDPTALGQDNGLFSYIDDVMTRFKTFKLFSESRPSVDDLRPHLDSWERLLASCRDRQCLYNQCDNPTTLVQQLRSIAAYFRMLGEDGAALSVFRTMEKLCRLLDTSSSETCMAQTELAQSYLDLGYSGRASVILEQSHLTEHWPKASDLVALRRELLVSECSFAVDELEKCATSIHTVRNGASAFSRETIPRRERRIYDIVNAKSWLLNSKLLLATGNSDESFRSAKRAVHVLNGIWSSLERLSDVQVSTPLTEHSAEPDRAVTGLAKGISKLQLTSTEDSEAKTQDQSKRGAAFWSVMPVLVKALLHLSDVYTHHGLFVEADYYSQRAIDVAESVASTLLLSRVRSHRCRLLTLAGRIEEAELCIVQNEDNPSDPATLVDAERCCARAVIKVKEGFLDQALELYERAEQIVDKIRSEGYLVNLEGPGDVEHESARPKVASPPESKSLSIRTKQTTIKVTQRPVKTSASSIKLDKERIQFSRPSKVVSKVKSSLSSHHVLEKIRKAISVEKALVDLQFGKPYEDACGTMTEGRHDTVDNFRSWLLKHQRLMQSATAMLGTNVTLSLLSESTLSIPGLLSTYHPQVEAKKIKQSGSKSLAKPTKTPAKSAEGPETLLLNARNSLWEELSIRVDRCSTSEAHSGYSSLSQASLLASAFEGSQHTSSSQQALGIDLPRIKALQLEKSIVVVERQTHDSQRQFTWPEDSQSLVPIPMADGDFQSEFIDILPAPWTAVSLCLSEDCNDLYIARYRTGQAPFVIKLPFSRHKPGEEDGSDDSPFDYRTGKAELQEIINLSNYTCHNPGNLNAKGAKSKWWKDREDLDRRLHELLINIENIWFGGFKALFSLRQPENDELSQFRTSFDQILARYLPSRKTAKAKSQNHSVHDHVLELFIGIATTPEPTADLEEPVTDLLYFVVDLLQFKGEPNAYDEIDFDSMAIDTLDAIQACHDAAVKQPNPSEHMILVLDRRLQAIPWESLPCLEGSSVSRVGSMLSLRDCILSMSRPNKSSGQVGKGQHTGCHTVCRSTGTYILNPSSDLTPTQTMLQPSLSPLSKSPGSQWTSIVNKIPSEEEFSTALQSSSMLLYFGHGGGSQYIRPRTIKRLERCSEVVWLMGCSSGAVWENGDLEPNAVPLAYLLAGKEEAAIEDRAATGTESAKKCLSVVATLWDVTDKDIDRFTLAVGEDWGLWSASAEAKLPAKTPKKREIVVQPSTPVQVPKTPKIPKIHKTSAIAKTPATVRSKSPRDDGRKLSLVEAVARSRDVCVLRYLNGAAPVIYGVPVYLGD